MHEQDADCRHRELESEPEEKGRRGEQEGQLPRVDEPLDVLLAANPSGASGATHHAEKRLRLRSWSASPTRASEARTNTTCGPWARYSCTGPGDAPVRR